LILSYSSSLFDIFYVMRGFELIADGLIDDLLRYDLLINDWLFDGSLVENGCEIILERTVEKEDFNSLAQSYKISTSY